MAKKKVTDTDKKLKEARLATGGTTKGYKQDVARKNKKVLSKKAMNKAYRKGEHDKINRSDVRQHDDASKAAKTRGQQNTQPKPTLAPDSKAAKMRALNNRMKLKNKKRR